MNTDTIFIRHKLSTTPDILETLWNEDLIAVHYIDDDSTDPEHYQGILRMARANKHYIPGHVWHITHRCHKREFLLKFVRDRRRNKFKNEWRGKI